MKSSNDIPTWTAGVTMHRILATECSDYNAALDVMCNPLAFPCRDSYFLSLLPRRILDEQRLTITPIAAARNFDHYALRILQIRHKNLRRGGHIRVRLP